MFGVTEMPQWLKVPAIKPDDLSLIPGTMRWKERSDPCCFLLSSTHALWRAGLYTHTNNVMLFLQSFAMEEEVEITS